MSRGGPPPITEVFLAQDGRRCYIGLLYLMPWLLGRPARAKSVMFEVGLSIDSGETWEDALHAVHTRLYRMKMGEDISGEGDPRFLLWALSRLRAMTTSNIVQLEGRPLHAGYVFSAASQQLAPTYARAASRLGWQNIGMRGAWADHTPVPVWFTGHPSAKPHV